MVLRLQYHKTYVLLSQYQSTMCGPS